MKLLLNILITFQFCIAALFLSGILYVGLKLCTSEILDYSTLQLWPFLFGLVISIFCLASLALIPKQFKKYISAANGNTKAATDIENKNMNQIKWTMRINGILMSVGFAIIFIFALFQIDAKNSIPGQICVLIVLLLLVFSAIKLTRKYWKN